MVELVHRAFGVHHLAPLGRPQGLFRHLPGVLPGQLVYQPGLALRHAGHVPEIGVHGAGAHRQYLDAPGPQLIVKGLGKGQHIGLGGGVHRHPGGRGKGANAGHVDDQAVVQHIGQAQPGDGSQGPAVYIHHAHLGGPVGGEEIPALAKARVVHQHLDFRLVLFQQLLENLQALLLGEVQGDGGNGLVGMLVGNLF